MEVNRMQHAAIIHQGEMHHLPLAHTQHRVGNEAIERPGAMETSTSFTASARLTVSPCGEDEIVIRLFVSRYSQRVGQSGMGGEPTGTYYISKKR